MSDQLFTGFQAAKFVNAKLGSLGLKEIPAQMIYNYKSKGYIKSVDRDGQNLITKMALESWLTKYVNKKMLASQEVVSELPESVEGSFN
jgi:hypothetical protein